MKKRVGIFAGTFDPIHAGHLAFAEAALQTGLEKVFFLVEPRPRRKQGVRALEHRIAMVDLAIADQPKFGQIVLKQARFTIHETLPVLQARFPNHQLLLLFGDDVISHVAHWPHVQELADAVTLLVASRWRDKTELEAAFKTLQQTRSLHFHYEIIQVNQPEVASSRIRLALKNKKTSTELLPSIADYIHKHRLYSSSGASK